MMGFVMVSGWMVMVIGWMYSGRRWLLHLGGLLALGSWLLNMLGGPWSWC